MTAKQQVGHQAPDGSDYVTLTDGAGNLSTGLGGGAVTNAGTFAVQDTQVVADNAGFTDGTSKVFTAGYIFDEVAGTALTENDAGAARIDSKRAQVYVIEDATTRGQRMFVGTDGAARVSTEGAKTTYSASATVTLAASTTDFFTLTGSGTKTLRVTKVSFSGTATAATDTVVVLRKYSTAASGGTSSATTAVPHDSANAAATGTVLAYSANPTTGSIVGNLRMFAATLPTAASSAIPSVLYSETFTDRNSQAIVLRGTSQYVGLNLQAATVAGAVITCSIEWTEE